MLVGFGLFWRGGEGVGSLFLLLFAAGRGGSLPVGMPVLLHRQRAKAQVLREQCARTVLCLRGLLRQLQDTARLHPYSLTWVASQPMVLQVSAHVLRLLLLCTV